jgi:hypothetical protein
VAYRGTSLCAANVHGLFTQTATTLFNLEFLGAIVARTWQIAENFARIATIENKHRVFI